MERSKFSNIIAITRLMPYFSNENISTIKSCIFCELGCENESQFICKALKSLYKTMSVESTTIIRNKAIEIADLQSMTQTQNMNHINTTDQDTQYINMTVCKFIEQQDKDRLSKLHSDIIDYFGTFLTKRESIEFGYLNKQLYIETQKQSYLIKRCKDDIFILNDSKIFKLVASQSNVFSYSYPASLNLRVWNSLNILQAVGRMADFQLFFRRLNTLDCLGVESLPYIPWQVLLNKNFKDNFYARQESRDKLEKLKIKGMLSMRYEHRTKDINDFYVKFSKYKNSVKNELQRCIKRLEIDITREWNALDDEDWQRATKEILITLGSISESIYLISGSLIIDTIEEMQTIFHENLKHLHLSSRVTIDLSKKIKDVNIGGMPDTNSKLESVEIASGDNSESNTQVITALNALDRFSLRRLIKWYIIDWKPSINYFHGRSNDINVKNDEYLNVFDKIFFQDYEKNPLLERIRIKFNDERDLTQFARLLLYFNLHYKKLFVERKFFFKHFKQIEIEWTGIMPYFGRTTIDEYVPVDGEEYSEDGIIFAQDGDEEYPVDTRTIEIKNIRQGVKHFGAIYQNVFQWLKSMQKQSQLSNVEAENPISGCKIVLFVE